MEHHEERDWTAQPPPLPPRDEAPITLRSDAWPDVAPSGHPVEYLPPPRPEAFENLPLGKGQRTPPAAPADVRPPPYQPPEWLGGAVAARPPGAPTSWPGATEYLAAVQDPAALVDPELRSATVAMGQMGVPAAATGQNAVVMQMVGAAGPLAVRCYTRDPGNAATRYTAIERHRQQSGLPGFVPARWSAEAIVVQGVARPAVVMPWVPGVPLNVAVADRLHRPDLLSGLAVGWLALVDQMRAAGVAHGDLQSGNVLVAPDESIRLVDLDSTWLPELSHAPPNEVGHPNFQHPARSTGDWGPEVDTFSGAVIFLSLRALAADPSLWRYHSGENLVLGADDLARPGDTPLWHELAGSSDPDVRRMASVISRAAAQPRPPVGGSSHLLARAVEQVAPTVVPPAPSLAPPPVVSIDTAGDWWDAAKEPAVVSSVVDSGAGPSAPRAPSSSSFGGALGRNSVVSGLFAGLLAGIVASLIQGWIAPSLPVRASTGVLVVCVAMLMGGLMSAWPMLTAGVWDEAAKRITVGAGLALVIGAVALLLGNAFFLATAAPEDGPIGAGVIAVVWAIVAGGVGLSIGLPRSLRAAGSGLVGGLVGGLIGGGLFGVIADPWSVSTTDLQNILYVNGRDASTWISVALTAGIIGLAIGSVDRVTRRAWVEVIEGRLKGRETILDKRSNRLGQGAACEVVMRGDTAVREVHAVIDLSAPQTVLQALGPVLIDGEQVQGRGVLLDGAIIQIGGSFVKYHEKSRAT